MFSKRAMRIYLSLKYLESKYFKFLERGFVLKAGEIQPVENRNAGGANVDFVGVHVVGWFVVQYCEGKMRRRQ